VLYHNSGNFVTAPRRVSEVNLLRDIGFDSTKHSGGFEVFCTAATLKEHVKDSVVTPTQEYYVCNWSKIILLLSPKIT